MQDDEIMDRTYFMYATNHLIDRLLRAELPINLHLFRCEPRFLLLQFLLFLGVFVKPLHSITTSDCTYMS